MKRLALACFALAIVAAIVGFAPLPFGLGTLANALFHGLAALAVVLGLVALVKG